MPLIPFIHVTAAYSNAVLVAILPHVSDFAKKLDLPIPLPITANQVAHFNVTPWKGDVGGSVWLTNHYQFVFGDGFLNMFQSPTNWFNNQYDNWDDTEYFKRYLGKDNMTTNEGIALARHSFYKLGYKPKDFDIRGPPTRFEGPANLKRLGHLPYCEVEWDSPQSKIRNWLGLDYNIKFDIDMQRKQIVGMNLSGRPFFRPYLKVDVTPELETNYRNAGLAGQFAKFLNSEPAVHLTPAYSNATLKATLPYVADFAKRLNLPVAQPLTNSQVLLFLPPLYYTNDGFRCTVMLTNYYWFTFLDGGVFQFGSPTNWFDEAKTRTNWPRFDAKTCMSTNEAVELARLGFHQLGYSPADAYVAAPPTALEMAVGDEPGKGQERYAYCRIEWDNPEENQKAGETFDKYRIAFDVDMRRKQLVGMSLFLSNTNCARPLPKIDMQPELESEYLKRTQDKMLMPTNGPSPIKKPTP